MTDESLERPGLRFLFVTPFLPSPPRFGGQRRVHGLMTALVAQGHRVSVVALKGDEDDVHGSIASTRAYCDVVETVEQPHLGNPLKAKRLGQLRSLASLQSWERRTYEGHAGVPTVLEALLARKTFDVIVFEFVFMSYFLNRRIRQLAGAARFVLDEHNIEYDILRRTASGGLARRVFAALNWRKLRGEEQRAWRQFHGCTVTSRRDEQLLRGSRPAVNVAVVPNGVDVDYFSPPPQEQVPSERTVMFFGANNYFPNADGIQYFEREMLPALRVRVPGIKLKIVGPAPAALMEIAGPDIEVTGYVDDVRPHLAAATAVIVPLRIGGGTRLKILEAMAMGKAVVSTSIGAEGIDVTHERDILIGDGPDAFVSQVVDVVVDAQLRRRLGTEARALIERTYSWGTSAECMASFIATLGPS